jgi:CHAT domain-containing protein/predicted negative regulator of RcsB-dependent stress response
MADPTMALDPSLLEQLATLEDPAQRKAFISLNPGLVRRECVTKATEEVWRRVRIDTQVARRFADVAIELAEQLGDPEAQAQSLRAKANTLYSLGEYAMAVELHESAARIFEALGNQSEVARTLSSSIQPLLLMGNYDRALEAGERARLIFQAEGNARRLARVEINIGNIFHRQDRFEEALACYHRAYEELQRHEDTEAVAAVLSNLAVTYISLNRFSDALASYETVRKLCSDHNMPMLVAQADYNIAYLYYLRGEYGRGIDRLRATRVSCKEVGERYHGALCNLDLSEIYLELNLHGEAAELAQEAIAGFHALGMGYEEAKATAFHAMAISQQGHAFEALDLFRQSRTTFVQETNVVWPSLIDLYQALVLYNEGRLFEARRLCVAALEFFRDSLLPNKAILCHLLLARICFQTGDMKTAGQECEAATAGLKKIEAPALVQQTYFLAGQIESALGRPEKAYEAYQVSRQALEGLRGSLRGEELKIAFVKNRLEVFECLVELCLKKGEAKSEREAFEYIEDAKSRALMERISRPVYTLTADDAGQSELVRTIRNLREELNWYYNLIEREQLKPEERSPERIKSLEENARAREGDLMRSLQELTPSQAEAAGLYTAAGLSLDEIQAAIPADTTVLEYFQAGERILACLVTRDSLKIMPVTLASRTGKVLHKLQFQLSKFRLGADYLKSFHDQLLCTTQAHLKELYDELLAPIVGGLECKHLVIVPHASLHYIPFHALWDGQQYILDKFSVSYAPSANLYALAQRRGANQEGPALVLGVPDDQAPLIADEVESLKSVISQAEVYVGKEASREVLRARGSSSRLVHIASHGYFRPDNPMFSAIRLGDSFLNLFDLYQLRLPVDLVTLSGCATGLNVVAAGDELLGLARGLFHAGARSLVLSLWEVNDVSTAKFMTLFYRELETGQSKPGALRQAALRLREQDPHPFYWAPFLLIGASSAPGKC